MPDYISEQIKAQKYDSYRKNGWVTQLMDVESLGNIWTILGKI